MATCGSLRHIFESTIPENKSSSSLIDSLSSWKQIRPLKPPANHSFTEIFGELHFKEILNPVYSPQSSQSDAVAQGCTGAQQDDDKWGNGASNSTKSYPGTSYHKRSESLPSLNSESLQLCTEGLGSESLGDVEDLKNELSGTWKSHRSTENNNYSRDYFLKVSNCCSMEDKVHVIGYSGDPYYRKGKTDGRSFPPPISCIGRTGKPRVCFQSYRQDGHFVLKEIRIRTHERLQASREDGRLRLCFIQPSDQDEDDDNGGDNDTEEAATGGEDEVRDEEELQVKIEDDGEGRQRDKTELEQEKEKSEVRMEE